MPDQEDTWKPFVGDFDCFCRESKESEKRRSIEKAASMLLEQGIKPCKDGSYIVITEDGELKVWPYSDEGSAITFGLM